MNRKHSRNNALLVVVAFLATALPVHAAPPTTDAAHAAHRLSFEQTMQRLSEQSHTTIICEGIPLDAECDDPDNALANVTPDADGITRVADAFDYDAESGNNHIILLRKRYSNENDLPCVTYDEVVHSLKAVLNLIAPYSDAGATVNFGDSSKLYRSLTEEQRSKAVNGLMVSELPEEQKSLARAIAAFGIIGEHVILLRQARDRLTALKDKQAAFQWLTFPDLHTEAFGFREPINTHGYIGDCPLDNYFRLTTYGAELVHKKKDTRSVINQSSVADGIAGDADPDPTLPKEIDRRLMSGMLANRLPSTRTLDELTHAWTAGSLGNDKPDGSAVGLHADVAQEIGEKPVCLFGGGFSRADQQIRAVSALYGLELLAPQMGEYHLIMPIPVPPKSPEDFPHQIERLMPPALIRQYAGLYAAVDLSTAAKDAREAARSGIPATRQSATIESAQRRTFSQSKANGGGYFPAVRRLLLLAKPLVPTKTSPPVRVTDANPEVLRLFAIMYYASDGCRKEIIDLIAKPLPDCLLHMDELIVKAIWHKSKQDHDGTGPIIGASWKFGYNDANGVYHRGTMFSGDFSGQ